MCRKVAADRQVYRGEPSSLEILDGIEMIKFSAKGMSADQVCKNISSWIA